MSAPHWTGVNHGNPSHNKGHLSGAASSSVERPTNGGSQVVQFIPIVVSETQKMNRAGRTLCKVVGCSRVDFSFTNGFCKYHHGLLYRGPVIYDRGERERDGAESWDCTCGQKISATKKRCWSCFKWRGGVKGTKSETTCAGDFSLPKPKKARIQKSKKFSGVASMRKRHNLKIHPVSAGKSKDESLLRNQNVPAFNSSTSSHLDMKKVRIAKKCSERWRAILMVTNHRRALASTNKDDSGLKDPFDCSDLIISPTIELVEREVAKAIQRWQDLDSRIVLEEDGSAGFYDGTSDENFFMMDGTIGDGRRQRLLPLNFDYKCERISGDRPGWGSASDSVEEHEKLHNYRPRVVSLLDPAQTLDYETELWHVFYSMPTASDLERRHALQSNKCENQQVVALPLGCRHTLQIKRELKTHLSEHTRMDAHSLGRMRVRDRHSTPRNLISQLRSDLSCLGFAGRDCQTKSYLKTSIRFEILRHSVNLKRGSGRDSNRLEVELSGSGHTLLDLHRLLIECASAAEGQGAGYRKESEERCDIAPAGVFFIENNFYTHGVTGEHVGRTILQWLNGHQSEDESGNLMKQATVSSRRNHLCLSSSCDLMPMSAIYLETLPVRLGMRYVHMFIDHSSKPSLCNESALFVTDIHTHPSLSSYNPETQDRLKNSVVLSRAPVIHDVWTPLKQIASCSACNSAAATVVTMNDELTDLSSTVTAAYTVRKSSTFNSVEFQGVMLCACCFRDLHYVESVGNNILRPRSSHMVFRALPVDVFNKLSLAKATEKIPRSALF
ncbi:hypothetical protein ACHAWX_001426 [Stephanocyclus meneghinianus]